MQKMGISLFSVENLLSHTAEKNRREIILCFKENVVSKFFCIGGGGGQGMETLPFSGKVLAS